MGHHHGHDHGHDHGGGAGDPARDKRAVVLFLASVFLMTAVFHFCFAEGYAAKWAEARMERAQEAE